HVVEAVVLPGALDDEHVFRLFHDADGGPVAGFVPADGARVGVGNGAADGAVNRLLPRLHDGLSQIDGVLPAARDDVIGQSLRRLGADARQLVQLVDKTGDGPGVVTHAAYNPGMPGMLSPPVTFAISSAAISLAERSASLTAASTMSCSISTSSGSMAMLTISWWPLATTLTMPPPAAASTVFWASSSCTRIMSACIFCTCFNMRLMLRIPAPTPKPSQTLCARRHASRRSTPM